MVVNGAHSVIAVGGATSAPAYMINVSNGTDLPAEAAFVETSAAPGAKATLNLANYWSAERVEIFWDGRTSASSSFVIGSNGGFSGQITIPTLSAGAHTIVVRGVDSGKSATATISLVPSMVLTPPIGAAGARIVVDVKGSTPGSTVSVYFNRPANGAGGTLACSAIARDSGTASCSFLVPTGFAVGTVVPITATGTAGNATALFEVRNDPVGFGPAEETVEEPQVPPAESTSSDPAPATPEDGTTVVDEEATAESTPVAEPTEATVEEPTPDPTPEPTPEPPAAPRVVNVATVADVTVYGTRPDDVGTEPFGLLNAGGEEAALTFITFNIEGIGAGTIVDARLVLTGGGTNGGNQAVSVVPGVWIDEFSATWNGLPTSGLTPATDTGWAPVRLPAFGSGETVWIDVTTSVVGDGMVTFVISGNPDALASFLSRESGNGPRLEITVQD
jgi:hypothetical protein